MRMSNGFLAFILAGGLALFGCQGADAAPESAEVQEEAPSQGAYLLVVNKSGNTLSVVDPETGVEVRTISTGFAPHEVAASADGRFAYVTDYGTGPEPGSTVTVVDLEAMEVARTISLDPHTRPHGRLFRRVQKPHDLPIHMPSRCFVQIAADRHHRPIRIRELSQLHTGTLTITSTICR